MKARILLIEPDFVLSGVYKEALTRAGYQVDCAVSAQTAIHLADSKKPDLVILELQLIEHSGIEFLYEFRSYPEWQTVPVIIQSQVPPSEFSSSWQIMKKQLGVGVYLYKPQVSLKQLISSVNQELAVVKA
jgi:DNA-binding response OmpR family regulator